MNYRKYISEEFYKKWQFDYRPRKQSNEILLFCQFCDKTGFCEMGSLKKNIKKVYRMANVIVYNLTVYI